MSFLVIAPIFFSFVTFKLVYHSMSFNTHLDSYNHHQNQDTEQLLHLKEFHRAKVLYSNALVTPKSGNTYLPLFL